MDRGFSLLELITALGIIGILTLLGIPLYSQHLIQEKRLEAKIGLSKLAQALEQYYVVHDTYENATFDTLNIPEIIADNQYKLVIASATNSSFQIQAAPLANQAQKDTSCGTLVLDSSGTKSITGSGNVVSCW